MVFFSSLLSSVWQVHTAGLDIPNVRPARLQRGRLMDRRQARGGYPDQDGHTHPGAGTIVGGLDI